MAQSNNLIFKWSYDPRSYESNRPIGLIHDSRHVSFQIVMQISHLLCWGGNIEKRQIAENRLVEILKVHWNIESTF